MTGKILLAEFAFCELNDSFVIEIKKCREETQQSEEREERLLLLLVGQNQAPVQNVLLRLPGAVPATGDTKDAGLEPPPKTSAHSLELIHHFMFAFFWN